MFSCLEEICNDEKNYIIANLPIYIGRLCFSNPPKKSDRYTIIGMQAQAEGRWDGARRAYARAVGYGEQAKIPVKSLAIRTYEYGRALGVTCFFEEAEDELNRAYELDKQAGEPLYLTLTELAKLMLDQKKYQKAVGYFERALKEEDSANLQQRAPIAYADFLDEYAQSTQRFGQK